MAISNRLLVIGVLSAAPAARGGDAYVPADDAVVLETLPTEVFARRDRVARLRERLAAAPDDARLAAQVAEHYVGLGKANGDPRYFGYAQAAIAPWAEAPAATPAILRVRAKLRETDHRYEAALADLQTLLEKAPDDKQAWIEVANIRRVLGDYATAAEACERLGDPDESVPALVAWAPLWAMTGRAEAAAGLLEESEDRLRDGFESVVPWALTMRAEIARALGRDPRAESLYREGLRAAPDNAYLRRAYADFLLDHDRGDEVLELLGERPNDNGALLRAAIAAERAGRSELAVALSERLKTRFEEIRLRGDLPHGRFEARYELVFGDGPARALELATANWSRQKEYRDARNLLEAALAADRPGAAADVVRFLAEHGTEDVILERLVQQIEER